MSYCDFYLKQLIKSIENPTGGCDLESKVRNESKISKQSSQLDSTEAVPFIPLPPVEDEIFEEDLSKTKTENQRLDTTSDDFDLPDRIDPLANKNLFYELKFALKFKSNEWRQREKIAIKKKTTTMKRDDQDENNTPEHLLDNEEMRYKSELRRRRRRITFVTYIEGDKEYMKRYATISKIIYFRPITNNDKQIIYKQNNETDSKYQIKFPYNECLDFRCNVSSQQYPNDNNNYSTTTMNETTMNDDDIIFIFGGDVWDQGGND